VVENTVLLFKKNLLPEEGSSKEEELNTVHTSSGSYKRGEQFYNNDDIHRLQCKA